MMKPHALVALGVLLGATASAATGVLTQPNAARPQPPARYAVRCLLSSEVESRLNQLGAQGWRLVTMTPATCPVTVSYQPYPKYYAGFMAVLGR